MDRDNKIAIRQLAQADLQTLWEYEYKENFPEWKKCVAPYFPHHAMPLESFT